MSLLRRGIRTEYSIGTAGQAGEAAVWTYNVGELWDGTSRLVIALHGHGTAGQDNFTPLQFNQNVGPGLVPMALALTGRYVVLGIEAAGAVSWSKPAVMDRIDAAVTAARTRGVKTGKYGLLGWSMGGLEVANKIKRDHANIAVAWTWSPALDLDYIHSTAGHVPIANNAGWTTEVETAFGTWAASAGYRVWDEPASYQGLGVPWRIAHATDDSVIPQSISTSFVAAVADADISMRTPNITGDHTMLFANVPDAEVVAFYDAGRWAA
jgi:dienelactone hydrolase